MEKFLRQIQQIGNRQTKEMFKLKKALSIGICTVMLCSLMLVGFVSAGTAVGQIMEYISAAPCTVDGKWTTADEWTDAPHTVMAGNASGKFAYDVQDFTNFGLEWDIEILSDNTNNTGDYVRICVDDGNGGGAAPTSGDYMIEITGHTTLKMYQGNGAGWTQVTPAAGEITWSTTLGTSMWSSTPHWILEIVDSSKTAGTFQVPNAPPTGMLVAAFDAATNQYCAWAAGGTANVPDTWGLVYTYSMDAIPEGINVGLVALLSTVVVLVGFVYLRKRPKTLA